MLDTNPLDSLQQVDDSSDEIIRVADSKKYKTTKRRINSICYWLTIETKKYHPEKTINQIDLYINTKDKMTRIPYSEISNHLFNLEPDKRATFLTNVENLLIYSLSNEDNINDDVVKIVIKIYDHTQLVNYQIENMNDIFAQRIVDAKVDLHDEINGVQKEYITILGIFASIMLAFVGAFTFSTSVLNNLGKAETLDLVAIALVIGLVFVLLVSILIDFLREINDKVVRDKNGKRKWNVKIIASIGVLAFVAVITIISLGVSKMSFPEKINIGNHQYQLVDEVTNGSGNISDVDNSKWPYGY